MHAPNISFQLVTCLSSFFKVPLGELSEVPGMDLPAHAFCLWESHPDALRFTMASAGRAVRDSGHQRSQQAWRQPASGIEEGSPRRKQRSVKMLDCRPAPGRRVRCGGLECPESFQTSGESLLGKAESISTQTQTQRNVWYSVPVLIRFGEL